MTQVPTPEFIFRLHQVPVNSLHFTKDGTSLISVDGDGYVAIWDLTSFRPLALLKAHEASILHAEDWNDKLITHGRDNKIHVFGWPSAPIQYYDTQPPSFDNLSTMQPDYTLEVNALTYCKFSLLPVTNSTAWVASPAILEDSLVDIYHLPSTARISRSIGKDLFPINDKTGTVMAVKLFGYDETKIRLLAAYEDGRMAVFETNSQASAKPRKDESEGWQLIYHDRAHKEPIMSLAISPNLQYAWTVAADHLIIRWTLPKNEQDGSYEALPTGQPGRACIAVRDDNRILAISGWDGKVRVHGVKTFKPLAVLDFHRDSVLAVAFAPMHNSKSRAWMAAAGKDTRISLWELYP